MITMIPLAGRRKNRRFIVSGRVRFVTGFDTGLASLVNLGEEGILIRSRFMLPKGTRGTFRVVPAGCPVEIEVEGQVVGVKDDLMAVRFLEERREVGINLQWLASENCPWTGSVAIGALGNSFPDASKAPEAAVMELAAAHDLVFQSA